MKEVARRQEISLKYLEKIMPLLGKANMVEGQHGKGGGYRLTMEPENYRIGDILRLTEVDLAPWRVCLHHPIPAPARRIAGRFPCGRNTMR